MGQPTGLKATAPTGWPPASLDPGGPAHPAQNPREDPKKTDTPQLNATTP